MARMARVVVPRLAHHVTHRGNHGQDVFFSDANRRRYLDLLTHYSNRFLLDIWAYCLMMNHVHLIVVGHLPNSMARAIGNAHREYSRHLNLESARTGHLWANRFYSTALDELHLWRAVRYVESNPLRAGMVESAVDYRWSSARVHAGMTEDPRLAPDRPFPGSIADWAVWLDFGREDASYAEIRRNTSTGHPTGPPDFTRRIKTLLGRSLPARRRGTRRTEG